MEDGEIIEKDSYYLTLHGPEYDYLRSVDGEYDRLPLYRKDYSSFEGDRASIKMLGIPVNDVQQMQDNLPTKEFSTEIIEWFQSIRRKTNFIYEDYSAFKLELPSYCAKEDGEDGLKKTSTLYTSMHHLSQRQLWRVLSKVDSEVKDVELRYFWFLRIFENLFPSPLRNQANILRCICRSLIKERNSLDKDENSKLFYLNVMIIIITNCFSQYDLFSYSSS